MKFFVIIQLRKMKIGKIALSAVICLTGDVGSIKLSDFDNDHLNGNVGPKSIQKKPLHDLKDL